MTEKSSRISGFYKLGRDERVERVKQFASLSDDEAGGLSGGALSLDMADRMVENALGLMEMPLGVAVNFLINGKDYLIPMAIEEPSVIAAASNAAKMARSAGGFFTTSTAPVMVGQVQLLGIPDPFGAKMEILRQREEILEIANSKDPVLVQFGGGAKDVEVRVLDTPRGAMVVVHLLVDCRDAMGANAVNTMAEAVAPTLAHITGGRPLLRIISNLADKRLVRARAVFPSDSIGGEEVVENILDAYALAMADPYRAATHNKGIMNGIIAVALATGNDTRAIEAGAHSYASRFGQYSPLTMWEKNASGELVGSIEIPMAVGLVGGATRTHPAAQTNIKILAVEGANELAEVMAAVGLAQNFAALRALATEGIQKGHMSLHSRNVAIAAGAEGEMVDIVADRMVQEGTIRMDIAKEFIEELKNG